MSLFRKFFLGINKSESRRYFEIIKCIEPADLPDEEWQNIVNVFLKGFIMKLVAVPSAVALGYFVPLPIDLGYPSFFRYFIGLVGYRTFVLQPNSTLYDAVKQVVHKYDLENVVRTRLHSAGQNIHSQDQSMGDMKDEAVEGIKEAEGKSQKDNEDSKAKPSDIDLKNEKSSSDETVDSIKDAEKGPRGKQ